MGQSTNLYIITGKGGVGKTTIAIALTKYLQNSGKNAKYAFFKNSSFQEQGQGVEHNEILAKNLGLQILPLELEQCALSYIARKLHSKLIAKAVIKTPFFRALVNMIPGFNYLIYLGQILQNIKDSNGEDFIVLDSPSSGHALTMLEATKNFQDIFRSGVIFDDTKKMLQLVNTPGFAKIHIVSIPTQLSVSESKELEQQVKDLSKIHSELWLNNSLKLTIKGKEQDIPDFIHKKLKIEHDVTTDFSKSNILPHCLSEGPENVVKDLLPHMQNLV